MSLSPYFADLRSAYEAELDDLTTDSGGHDVLAKRLKEKRAQLPQLLSMLECNPEMVAVAFHGGIRFLSLAVMRDLVAREADDLPSWSELRVSLELAPWVEELARVVLQDASGDRFLVVTACLEYLQGQTGGHAEAPGRRTAADDGADDGDEGEDQDMDLEEAGADWLSEQGFERRDRFSDD